VTAATLARRLEALRHCALARAIAAAARPARAWLVGGAVRDAALGRATRDLDAVVERDAAGAAQRLARAGAGRSVALGGDRFAAHRVVLAAATADLWDLDGTALEDDLARRDFTVNAMALDLEDGTLVDPFGGLADLERRRLRATRESVFAEDPLRVVRLARLAATLEGFGVESATAALARATAGRLTEVAGERIRQELGVLWRESGFGPAQAALEAAGAWPGLWRPPARELATPASAHSAATRLDAALGRLRATGEPAARPAAGHALAARAAAGTAALAAIEALAARRALTRSETRDTLRLAELAARDPPRSAGDLAWFLHCAGGLWPLALALGRATTSPAFAAAWDGALAAAPALFAARGAEILAPPRLLRGEEIADLLGVGPGPAVGAADRRLREAQVRGEVTDREAAARRVAAWRGTGDGG